MPPSRLILMVVMALSAAGLLLDRLFLREPTAAKAEEQPLTPSAASLSGQSAKSAEPARGETATTDDPSLSWLNRLEDTPEMPRDIFTPSEELLEFLAIQASGKDASAEAQKDENDPARFEATHTLQATFLSDDRMMAMIDGKVVRVGSVLDGYTVVRIASRHVECMRDGRQAILRMELPKP